MKKILAILMSISICTVAAGCTETASNGYTEIQNESISDISESAQNSMPDNDNAEVLSSETEEKTRTHIVVDHSGTEVEVPDNVKRVVIDQIPILSTYMSYFGGNTPYLVGFCGAFKDITSKTVLKDIAPELLESANTVYAQSDLNIEEIIKLEPDVILYNAANTAHKEIFEASGIPAIGFATSANETAGKADPFERYVQWLRLLEDVFGENGKNDEFISAGKDIISDVEKRIAQIPEDSRPSAVIIAAYSDGTPAVSGANFFGHFWLQRLGVKNPAADGGLMAHAQVSMEQIYTWNPDILLLDGPGLLPFKSSDVIENKIEGIDFSSLDAVKNGKVYNTTLGMWNWYTPNPDIPLVYAWLACKIYPDSFSDYDLEGTIREYYKNWYVYDVTDTDITEMLLY